MKKALRIVLCLTVMLFAPIVWNAVSPLLKQLQLDFLALLLYSTFVIACVAWAFHLALKDQQI